MSKKWTYAAGVAVIAALFVATQMDTALAQVRAALVQEVTMQGFQPFVLQCGANAAANPSTSISCVTAPVPAGKRFVVEHISGEFVIGQNDIVDSIEVRVSSGGVVRLPTHFAGRLLNYGFPNMAGRAHQYGSPARLYVPSNQTLSARGDAGNSGIISMAAIGYLVNE